MNETSRLMLLIQSLDPRASLEFSEYTQMWYVEAQVTVGGDGFLRGITAHRPTPDEAVRAFMGALESISLDEYLVTNSPTNGRRHWRWNGAGFRDAGSPSPDNVGTLTTSSPAGRTVT